MARSVQQMVLEFDDLLKSMEERDRRVDGLHERIGFLESEIEYMKIAKQPHREPIRIPPMPKALLSLEYHKLGGTGVKEKR
jgi:hypothetical protein